MTEAEHNQPIPKSTCDFPTPKAMKVFLRSRVCQMLPLTTHNPHEIKCIAMDHLIYLMDSTQA